MFYVNIKLYKQGKSKLKTNNIRGEQDPLKTGFKAAEQHKLN